MNEPRRVEGNARGGRGRPRGSVLPWDALGPDVAATLLPAVEDLVEQVLSSVAQPGIPREWVEGMPNARHGVERGVRGVLELIETGPRDRLPARDLYFGFGRGQLRAGRSLGTLLDAYHLGARAMWRALADTGNGAGLAPETLSALADAILAYVAEISAASAEGFAFEESAGGADRHQRRQRLVTALVRSSPPSPAELRAAVGAVGWRATAPVGVLAFVDERVRHVAARLPADALVAWVDGLGHAIVPDPDAPGRRAELRARLHGLCAALGPTVALADAAESAHWARLALALCEETDDTPGRLVIAAERRVDLLLLCAPQLAGALADEALAPLATVPEATRERLLETLAVWLRHQGAVRATAEQLHVHAQTVRYRIAQLQRLLDARMHSAEGRLELELALRARRLRPPDVTAGGRRASPCDR